MSRESLQNGALVLVTICAVASTLLVVRREFLTPPSVSVTPSEVMTMATVKEWGQLAQGGSRIGTPGAQSTLVVFSDYECPYCKEFAKTVDSLLRAYPEQLAVVFRHFPLTNIHRHAMAAAIAAECARAQGRFVSYHELLFSKQDSIGRLTWLELARRAGIPDLRRFEECSREGEPSKRIASDVAAGDRLGLYATPTVLLNGLLMSGVPSRATLDSLLKIKSHRVE